MRKANLVSVLSAACVLATSSCGGRGDDDQIIASLKPSDVPGLFDLSYENAPLGTVIEDVLRVQTNMNIVVSKDCLERTVICWFMRIEPCSALTKIVEDLGYVLEESHPNFFTLRDPTEEEMLAASSKRLFDALRKEGFTEEQAMQILLHSLDDDD